MSNYKKWLLVFIWKEWHLSLISPCYKQGFVGAPTSSQQSRILRCSSLNKKFKKKKKLPQLYQTLHTAWLYFFLSPEVRSPHCFLLSPASFSPLLRLQRERETKTQAQKQPVSPNYLSHWAQSANLAQSRHWIIEPDDFKPFGGYKSARQHRNCSMTRSW